MSNHGNDSLKQLLAESFAQIEKLEQQLSLASKNIDEEIAIIGTSCRYPGKVSDLDEFWQALETGNCLLSEHSNQRWDADRFFSADPSALGRMYTKSLGLLDQIDEFDAELFGITARELDRIDPQQRILLELTWEALENAGYSPYNMLGKNTGVYVGLMNNDYAQIQGDLSQMDAYTGSGVSFSCAAGRISYNFGLQGPAMTVDTACSSSLVTVHLAAQALKMHECDTAIAGGINLILSPQSSVVACRAKMLSAQGRCATFDEEADGYARSEGGGLVVLKRLADAKRDNDKIYAVIKGSAINQDGRSQGLSAPNGAAQRQVIQRALAVANVSAEQVNYVECHGTGTPLGDPIEVRALYEAYVKNINRKTPLVLGALKANMGHMESAAGVGALHKTVKVLEHKKAPKNANFTNLNPKIDVDMEHIAIASEARELVESQECYAGISSFGFSGTNVHMILAPAPETDNNESSTPTAAEQVHIFKLSAETPKALIDYAQLYCDFLSRHADDSCSLDKICYGAALGRHDAAYKIAVTTTSKALLLSQLQEYIDVMGGDESQEENKGKILTTWTLSGKQYSDYSLLEHLFTCFDYYRKSVRLSLAIVDITEEYFLASSASNQFGNSTQQLLIQAVHELALADLLIKCQIKPKNIRGYGYAEGIAAVIAGLVDKDQYLNALMQQQQTLQCKIPKVHTSQFISTCGNSVASNKEINVQFEFSIDNDASNVDLLEENNASLIIENGLLLYFADAVEDNIFRWVNKCKRPGNKYDFEFLLCDWYMTDQTLDWTSLFAGKTMQKLALPTYPYQRERYWTNFGFVFDRDSSSTVGQNTENTNAIWASEDKQDVTTVVNNILQKIFKTDKALKQDRLLLELGMDSLMAVELINHMRGLFQVDIQISQLMGEMTVNDLVTTIEQSKSVSHHVDEKEKSREVVEIEI